MLTRDTPGQAWRLPPGWVTTGIADTDPLLGFYVSTVFEVKRVTLSLQIPPLSQEPANFVAYDRDLLCFIKEISSIEIGSSCRIFNMFSLFNKRLRR